MPQQETSLIVAILPLVGVIVILARFVIKNVKDIAALSAEVGGLRGEVSTVRQENEELKKENANLIALNMKWRQAARKWYQIAIAVAPQLRDQVEDGLEEPTDL